MNRVVTRVQQAHTKRSQAAVLRVALLQVAQSLCELLDGDLFIVGEQVALGGGACIIDERVGVRGDARYAGDDVAKTANGSEHTQLTRFFLSS